jgi:hypothetical protein
MSREHLNFSVIREDFNFYETVDGPLLKAKQVVTDIIAETKQDNKKMINLSLKDVSLVLANVPIDTTGFEVSSSDKVTEKDQSRELKFRPIKEFVNIYETEGAILFLASKVQKVFLTNKKDNTGIPILRYETLTGFSLLDKTTLFIRQPPASAPILTTSERDIFSERFLCELCRQTNRSLTNSRKGRDIYMELKIGAFEESGIPQLIDEMVQHLKLNDLISVAGDELSLTSKGIQKCNDCRD